MPILCKPAVAVPEHIITLAETLALMKEHHANHPELKLAMQLVRNLGVKTRHIIMPISEALEHPGLEVRNDRHDVEAQRRLPPVIEEALKNAQLTVLDIDVILYVSCTSYRMPSMTAWLINNLGFRPTTRQIPINQLGCAAGGSVS